MLGWVILPGDGDHVLGQCLDEVRAVLRDVAPEEETLSHRPQYLLDLLKKAEIYRAESFGTDAIHGLAAAELEGLVGADVNEGAGKERIDLGEHLANELHRLGLARSEHVTVRRFGQRRVQLVLE